MRDTLVLECNFISYRIIMANPITIHTSLGRKKLYKTWTADPTGMIEPDFVGQEFLVTWPWIQDQRYKSFWVNNTDRVQIVTATP